MIDKKQLKFGCYVRKSTEDDSKQVQSLDDQLNATKQTAREQGIRIVVTLKESRSAKKPHNRPEFDKLIEMIEAGKINAILCWEFNRLSRNPTDTGRLQQLLLDGKIQCIQTSSKAFLPDDNALMLSVEGGMSAQFIADLMKNVRRGLNSRVVKGWKPGTAPVGYKNNPYDKNIIPDPERFDTVKKVWELMLTGTYSVAEITDIAKNELGLATMKRHKTGGIPLSPSGMNRMFHDPFYRGDFRWNGVHKGEHKPMVTPEEWDKVQTIINPHESRPKDSIYDFMFRGLIRCGECGYAMVTVQKEKHQKNGNTHVYRYCHCSGRSRSSKCSQRSVFVREEKLNEQIKDFLTTHTIDPEFYQLAIDALAEMNDDEVTEQQSIAKQQNRAIDELEEQLRELGRMRYRGLVDDDFYLSESKELESNLKKLQKARNKAESKAVNWRAVANDTFNLARYAKEDYDNGDFDQKRAVIFKLGQNLTLFDGKVQFDSVKYLIPISEAYAVLKPQLDLVRTSSQQIEKASEDAIISTWYTREDLNLHVPRDTST